VARYAVSSAEFLQQQGADFLVIACNTASALALDEIRAASSVPVLGVIETGVQAAAAASKTKSVVVLGTAATIGSHAYATELAQIGIRATEKACPLLVPLVEEGWAGHAVTEQVVQIYLAEALAQAAQNGASKPDTLLLGCTHYPLLRDVFARHAAAGTAIVDSADVTAARAAEILQGLAPTEVRPDQVLPTAANADTAMVEFFVTDSAEQFQRLGSRFLARQIENVRHVELAE
jgi:glutamate racemase